MTQHEELVVEFILSTIDDLRQGFVAIEAQHEFYDFEEAEKLADFNTREWLESKANLDRDVSIDYENQRLLSLSLAHVYVMPRPASVDKSGGIFLKFSSPIQTLNYDELAQKYIWLYTADHSDADDAVQRRSLASNF